MNLRNEYVVKEVVDVDVHLYLDLVVHQLKAVGYTDRPRPTAVTSQDGRKERHIRPMT